MGRRKKGSGDDILYADSTRINAVRELADEFLDKVFDVSCPFMSDRTMLADFGSASDTEWLKQRCIRAFELYGVQCAPDNYLVDVLERIQGAKNGTGRTEL